MSENKISINKNIMCSVDVAIVCGKCKKPLYNIEHYVIYNGESIATFEIFPCDCSQKKEQVDDHPHDKCVLWTNCGIRRDFSFCPAGCDSRTKK